MSHFYEKFYSAFSALFEIHSTFPDKPFSRAPIYGWLRMPVDGATSKSLQRHIGLEFVDKMVEFVGQNPYYTSNLFAEVLNCCNTTVMGRCYLKKTVGTVDIPQIDLKHDHTYLTLPNGLIGFPLIKP